MTDRKNIESTNIEGLIPRQLIEDSQTLLDFLKEYYRFLNDEGGPTYALNTLLQNRDVDTAVDDFLELIHNEIGAGFAKEIRTLQADKNNLYKHIKEFYSCKGSLDSFQTLFKLLFNVNVEIILPKEKMLIASDGRWVQQESFFIETTTGEPLALAGKIITVTSLNNFIEVEVERIRKVYPAQDFYEIFITRNINTNRIVVGATIDDFGVLGTVVESLGNIEVIYSGQNFDPPQFVNVNYQSTGTLIRVSEVDSNSGISKIKIISFGIGYTNDFYARIVPKDEIVGGIDLVPINEEDIDAEIAAEPTHAILKFTNGAIAKYQGEYISNKGFLSDDIYLQDNFYYQNYSYVIRSGIQINNYRNIVRKTVHPAGMIFFGEFEITNFFDLSENIQTLARYLQARLASTTDANDVYEVIFYKNLVDGAGDTSDALDTNATDFDKELPQIDTPELAGEDDVIPGDILNAPYNTNDTPPISRSGDEREVAFFKNTSNSLTVDNFRYTDFFKELTGIYGSFSSAESNNSYVFEKELPQIDTPELASQDDVTLSDNVADDYSDGITTYEIERIVAFNKIIDPIDPTEDYATPGDILNSSYFTIDTPPISRPGDEREVDFFKNTSHNVTTSNFDYKNVFKNLIGITGSEADTLSNTSYMFEKELPQIDTPELASQDDVTLSDNVAADYDDGSTIFEIERIVTFNKIIDPIDPTEDYATPGDENEKVFSKNLSTNTNPVQDDQAILLSKGIINSVDALDSNASAFVKNIGISGFDTAENTVTATGNDLSTIFRKNLSNNVTTQSEISFIMQLGASVASSADAISLFSIDITKPFTNDISIISNISDINYNKNLNNDININEEGLLQLNPYTLDSEYYFANTDYTEGNYIIT